MRIPSYPMGYAVDIPMQKASWLICFLLQALIELTASTILGQENNRPPKGFVALFNGNDIDSWSGATTRDPREIAALSPSDHSAYLAKMKRDITRHWRVADGVLVSDGQEPYLATTSEYGDFELWV